MPDLNELQATFRRHVMFDDPAIGPHIEESVGPDSERRLAVYAHAYRARLVEALATDYAVINELLGDGAFRDLCHRYLEAWPSTHYSLRWFGRRLPAYLRAVGPDHLAELAAFEWQLAAAFDARNAPLAGPESAGKLAAADWPAVRVVMHPSVRALELAWNTLDMWRSVKEGEPAPTPHQLAQPGHCLIWRDGLLTRYRSLSLQENAALAAALSGASFAEICEVLDASGMPADILPLRVAGFLKSWLSQGLVSELKIRDRSYSI